MVCIGFLLMFCTPPEQPQPVDTFCLRYQPVRLSHADTRLTKEQVDINNRLWKTCNGH